MSAPEKPDIPGWFGLRRVVDWSKARWLGPLLSVVVFVLFVMAVMVVGAVLMHALVGLPLDAPRIGFGTGAVAVAVIGAPFVIWRAVVAQKTVSVQEQGHITDRINKAVEGLGATKLTKTVFETPRYRKKNGDWERDEDNNPIPAERPDGQHIIDREIVETSEPNLEVRIGAIYALERIAQDSDRDHVQIMEILCAYIRQNAPVDKLGVDLRLKENTISGPHDLDEWTDSLEPPRLDIQTALTVLGRRTHDQLNLERVPKTNGAVFRLDLKHTCLRKAALTGLNFSNAVLFESQLDGAYLNDTNFECANLDGCSMAGVSAVRSNFNRSRLISTDFTAAILDQASFLGTNHKLACFTDAQTVGAKF
ncbi:MAG: pentapeptide repeat-containing protein [Roseovarius sp.]|uniref:pentapeptide repeat-containing protein n=1 Tax=Roseovarius sp. TaxID=1486281 RepID=UPI0040584C47